MARRARDGARVSCGGLGRLGAAVLNGDRDHAWANRPRAVAPAAGALRNPRAGGPGRRACSVHARPASCADLADPCAVDSRADASASRASCAGAWLGGADDCLGESPRELPDRHRHCRGFRSRGAG